MKTSFTIVLLLAVLIYSAKPIINFKPFTITFEAPYIPFALFFLLVSLSLYQIQYKEIGFKEGVNKTIDYLYKTQEKQK